jgi:C_GCAxxG_C_C family probable redox protein
VEKREEAKGLHEGGANCAQSVLCPFAAELGADRETCLRVATGFGAGMGRLAGICGAVTGGFMALGLAHGMSRPEDKEAKEKTYGLVREMARRFSEAHGTVVCRELLGVDVGTPEGMAAARSANLFKTRCNGFIDEAVGIVRDILAENPIERRSDTHG